VAQAEQRAQPRARRQRPVLQRRGRARARGGRGRGRALRAQVVLQQALPAGRAQRLAGRRLHLRARGAVTPGRAASAGLLAAPGRPRTRLASRACSWTTGEAAAVVKMLASRPLAGCSSSAATSAGLGRLRPISRPNTCAVGSQHAEQRSRALGCFP